MCLFLYHQVLLFRQLNLDPTIWQVKNLAMWPWVYAVLWQRLWKAKKKKFRWRNFHKEVNLMSQHVTKIYLRFHFPLKNASKDGLLPSSFFIVLRTPGAKLQGNHFFYGTLAGRGCQELLPIHGDHCRCRRYKAAGSVMSLLSLAWGRQIRFCMWAATHSVDAQLLNLFDI